MPPKRGNSSTDDVRTKRAKIGSQKEEKRTYLKDLYYPERILSVNTDKDGTQLYRIKWQNEPISEATWEPADNFKNDPILMSTLSTVHSDEDILSGAAINSAMRSYDKDVWIYVRVSSEEQSRASDGHTSLDDQEKKCRNECVKNNWRVKGVVREVHSARDMAKMTKLNALLDSVTEGDIIMVAEPSRFARNAGQGMMCLKKLADTMNVDVHFLDEKLNYSNTTHRFHIHNLLVAAQHVSDTISHKVKSSQRYRRERGDNFGPPPFGFKVIRDPGNNARRFTPDTDLLKAVFNHRQSDSKEISAQLIRSNILINNKPASVTRVNQLLRNIRDHAVLAQAFNKNGQSRSR
jgi:DNA invertase Pin-like site-specific DNA recombinase